MAAGHKDGWLTEKQIRDIAPALPSRNIAFALGYLRLKRNTVDRLVAEIKDSKVNLNRGFVQAWTDENPGNNQVTVSQILKPKDY